MPILTKMIQTCGACPSQWDGWDANGTYYHFRYRWGCLRVDTAPTEEDWDSPIAIAYGAEPTGKCETIYCEELGDDFDGFMSYEDLKTHLSKTLTLPDHEER